MESKEDRIVNHFKDELEGYMGYVAMHDHETDQLKKQGYAKMAQEELSHASWLHNNYKCIQDYVASIDKEISELHKMKELIDKL
ncbi:MAG: hypothetical protein ACRCZK_01780 [Oscillospiraceae bacterium]